MRSHSLRPVAARPVPCQRQRGQALSEFLVLAIAIVPLAIGMPLAFKYLDIMWSSEQAARYAAFEATVNHTGIGWKSDDLLAKDIRERLFVGSTAPILSEGAPQRVGFERNKLWTDRAGRDLLAPGQDAVVVNSQVESFNPIDATFLHRASLGLPIDNFYTGTVTLKFAGNTGFAPLDALKLQTSRRFALLADEWTARNPAEVRERIEGSAVSYPIGAVAKLVNPLGQLPRLTFDPAFVVGDGDWDNVPDDRKVEGR